MAGKKASASIPDWPTPEGYKLRIHWDDTDCTKRVYLGKYIKWIDDACTEYLRERGLVFSPEGWLSLNGKELDEGFVVGEYTCRIEQTSDFDDVLTVKIGIKEKRPKVVVFKGDITDHNGRLVAHGTLTYIYIKRGMKAVEMPEAIVDLLK
jgi:YbgC/YbaW family acyl-CoA thioester hydrolase